MFGRANVYLFIHPTLEMTNVIVLFWGLNTEGNCGSNYLSIVVNISNSTLHFQNKSGTWAFCRIISANITGTKK